MKTLTHTDRLEICRLEQDAMVERRRGLDEEGNIVFEIRTTYPDGITDSTFTGDLEESVVFYRAECEMAELMVAEKYF